MVKPFIIIIILAIHCLYGISNDLLLQCMMVRWQLVGIDKRDTYIQVSMVALEVMP